MGCGYSTFPFVQIDMIHRQENIFLRKIIKTTFYWNHSSDQFMIDFNTSWHGHPAHTTIIIKAGIDSFPMIEMYFLDVL